MINPIKIGETTMENTAIALPELDAIFAVEPKAKPVAKKKAKPAAKAKAKPAAEPVITAEETKAQPVVLTFNGNSYELAQGADPEALAADVAAVSVSLDSIQRKDVDLLQHYLELGKFQSAAAKMFNGTKTYGLFLKAELPASQALDVALRSNCKWLYEALNVAGADGSDLLNVLGVNRIEDFKSANPTVIKREYKNALKEAERKAELEAAAAEHGVDVEAAEKLLHEAKEKKAKQDQANAKRKLTMLEKDIIAHLSAKDSVEFCAETAASFIRGLLEADPKEQFAYIESLVG